MARRRSHQPTLPSIRIPPEALAQADALAHHLAEGGDLPATPVPIDLRPGEVGHGYWPTGTSAARFSRLVSTPYVPPFTGGLVVYDRRLPLVSAASLLLRHGPRTPLGRRRARWQPIAGDEPLSLIATSQRLILGTGDTIALPAVTEVAPRADDRSAIEITSTASDRLLLWGEHVPHLVTILESLLEATSAGRRLEWLPLGPWLPS